MKFITVCVRMCSYGGILRGDRCVAGGDGRCSYIDSIACRPYLD